MFRGRVAQLRQRDPRLAAYLATTRPLSRALAALTDMGDQEVGAGVETLKLTSISQCFVLYKMQLFIINVMLHLLIM